MGAGAGCTALGLGVLLYQRRDRAAALAAYGDQQAYDARMEVRAGNQGKQYALITRVGNQLTAFISDFQAAYSGADDQQPWRETAGFIWNQWQASPFWNMADYASFQGELDALRTKPLQ
jgi:hypothetical protein